MRSKLTSNCPGVVHCGKHRTRLRIPRHLRQPEKINKVKDAVEEVPGVVAVEVNPHTGSVLVQHEVKSGLLDAIGEAIGGVEPDILVALVAPEAVEEKLTHAVADALHALSTRGQNKGAAKNAIGQHGSPSPLRSLLTLVLLAGAGFRAYEKHSLLASTPPVLLLYLAFDLRWKLKINQRTARIERKLNEQAEPAS